MIGANRVLGPIRAPFLILGPACVLVGAGTAYWSQGSIPIVPFLLALVGTVAAHISVNALNEYADYQSGLDMRTTRTPFSGGSGTLPTSPGWARSTLIIGLAGAAVAVLTGGYLLCARGVALLPLGLLGLLVILVYTPLITHNPILCLIAPGLGFGILVVMGTDFVLTRQYSWTGFVASLVPFFLVSDLLLLNQFPDADADRTVGRRHLPIVVGKKASGVVYGLFLLGSYLAIIAGVLLQLLPPTSLLALATLLLAVPAARAAYLYAEETPKLVPYMGINVLINILTPVLLAVGLFVAR